VRPGRTKANKPKKERTPRSNRRARAAAAAVLMATVGAAVLVTFVRGAEDRALAGQRLVEVLMVKERVPAGTAVADLAGRVRKERLPAKTRTDGAVADLASVDGLVTSVELLPGEQVSARRLVSPEDFGRNRGQVDVPEDLLEVTVSLEPQRAVGGVIRPGSRVGVVASFQGLDAGADGADGAPAGPAGRAPESTHMVLHKVLVTNLQSVRSFDPGIGGGGREEDAGDGQAQTAPAPSDNLLVTLALDAPSVERVVFAAEHGSLWLATEPDGASEGGTQVLTRGSIYR